jgi:basic membrane protein A
MKLKRWIVAIVVLALMVALVGCGPSNTPNQSSSSSKPTFKVGLVTDTGGLNDRGFNHLSYVGLMQAQKDFGIQTAVVESKQMTDYETNLSRFAQENYNLVIAVGGLMADAVTKVSQEYPNTKFLIIDADVQAPNVTCAEFRVEQSSYLVGMLAGLMEQNHSIPLMKGKNTIGIVVGMKIPAIMGFVAGYAQGARTADPGVKILIDYTGSFDDPALGQQAALNMYNQGADIVYQVAGDTGTGVIDAAKQQNLYVIGVDADQNYLAPNNVITSATKRVDTATYETIKALVNNSFKSGDTFYDLANQGVDIAPMIKVIPQSIQSQVMQAKQDIISGKIKVTDQAPADLQ